MQQHAASYNGEPVYTVQFNETFAAMQIGAYSEKMYCIGIR